MGRPARFRRLKETCLEEETSKSIVNIDDGMINGSLRYVSVPGGMHDHLTDRINTLLIHDLHGALGMCSCPANPRFIN